MSLKSAAIKDAALSRERMRHSKLFARLRLSLNHSAFRHAIHSSIFALLEWLSKCSSKDEMSPSWPETRPPGRSKVMWMRACAVCKSLVKKRRLCDSVHCQCGWQW